MKNNPSHILLTRQGARASVRRRKPGRYWYADDSKIASDAPEDIPSNSGQSTSMPTISSFHSATSLLASVQLLRPSSQPNRSLSNPRSSRQNWPVIISSSSPKAANKSARNSKNTDSAGLSTSEANEKKCLDTTASPPSQVSDKKMKPRERQERQRKNFPQSEPQRMASEARRPAKMKLLLRHGGEVHLSAMTSLASLRKSAAQLNEECNVPSPKKPYKKSSEVIQGFREAVLDPLFVSKDSALSSRSPIYHQHKSLLDSIAAASIPKKDTIAFETLSGRPKAAGDNLHKFCGNRQLKISPRKQRMPNVRYDKVATPEMKTDKVCHVGRQSRKIVDTMTNQASNTQYAQPLYLRSPEPRTLPVPEVLMWRGCGMLCPPLAC